MRGQANRAAGCIEPIAAAGNFMDALDPIYNVLPTYRLLHQTMRAELRILLAGEALRWVEPDVPAGRTAKVHLALARRLNIA